MITILTSGNRHEHEVKFDQMFRLRHRVLFEQMGWEEVYKPDGRDIDESDHAHTIYVVSTRAECDGVVGCVRLAASNLTTLSAKHFPNLFDRYGVPSDPEIYDVSRIVVAPETKKLGRPNPVTIEIHIGWLETACALGLKGVTAVVELWRFQRMVATGFKATAMGLPVTMGDLEVIGVKVDFEDLSLESVRAFLGLKEPIVSAEGIIAARTVHADVLKKHQQRAA
ncbi:MAG: GNAT family N-acetyltransferase [Alphaproteobacteria bacterium]|nr:GNAT family N-acetyltransferase [Alphaproteobacteria bacterium]